MRIAVDVMGGDEGCGVVVNGVGLALQAYPAITKVYLVGNDQEIGPAMAQHKLQDPRVEIVHTTEVLTMDDKPLQAVRKKKDSSLVRTVGLVKDNAAQAMISQGNTGALIAAATLILRRLEGVEHPAIAAIMPSYKSDFLLIDAGAKPDCKPVHLQQFAIMGNIYAREILGHKQPRVGILCNGTEEHKGNEVTREAAKLCQGLNGMNFKGYVEGHDMFSDKVDVVVTDGFTGNIVLKSCEGIGKGMMRILKRELIATPIRRMGAVLAGKAFANLKQKFDPDVYGGAPILGLNGTVIKAHGAARQYAIMNALRVCTEAIQHHINDMIQQEIERANQAPVVPTPAAVPA